MDRNGYNDSLFDTEDGVCWLCGTMTGTVRHELFKGRANRSNSKAAGLWIAVCPHCHRLLHKHAYEEEMHRIGQVMFIHAGGTEADFVLTFGKNYIHDDAQKEHADNFISQRRKR